MSKTYLLLGGNIGDTEMIFLKTISSLETNCGNILKKSSIYKSEAWGFKSESIFLNQVILVETNLKPEELLQKLLSIEKTMGRERGELKGYSSRVIDIDILFYDDLIITGETLKIPHPLLHKRKFTLMPLNEIAPDYIHPLLLKSITELLMECDDKLNVTLYK